MIFRNIFLFRPEIMRLLESHCVEFKKKTKVHRSYKSGRKKMFRNSRAFCFISVLSFPPPFLCLFYLSTFSCSDEWLSHETLFLFLQMFSWLAKCFHYLLYRAQGTACPQRLLIVVEARLVTHQGGELAIPNCCSPNATGLTKIGQQVLIGNSITTFSGYQ